MDWLVPALLVLIVVMASLASCGWDLFEMRNREVWWWCGVLALLIVAMPNFWAAALLSTVVMGVWQIGRAWYLLRTRLFPIAGLAGAYALMAPFIEPWMIVPVLWGMVGVGCGLGVWALVGWWQPDRPYQYIVPESWFGKWGIYEGDCYYRTTCGQGNEMHLNAMAALMTTAAIGLLLLNVTQPLAWGGLVICVLPILICTVNEVQRTQRRWRPNQGVAALAALLIGLLFLYDRWLSLAVLIGMPMLILATAQPWRLQKNNWWDSGRMAYWWDVIKLVWWPQGWQHRLFGFGTGTWFLATAPMGSTRHGTVYTAAHNEYVQQLVEHGIVGLLILLGYLGDALWRTVHGGPEGQAVFLVGLVFCAVACINFPWTFFHQYVIPATKEEQWFGSPSLTALAFVVAVLAEAF